MTKHLLIPDTQVKPGVDVKHIVALGHYILDQMPDVIVMIGDWWDLPSLSTYEDRGSKYFHDKTYKADVEAGNAAMQLLLAPLKEYQRRARKNKKKQYNPRLVFCLGNHENRIERAVHADPKLEGTIGYHDLYLDDWEVHDFREIVEIDGILYSHFFVNQKSLKKGVLGGSMDNKLSKVMRSFSMGHQQIRQIGWSHDQLGNEICGLVAGAFYSHDEDYMGPQGNHYWRGVVIKNEVDDGSYDPMFVSLRYLVKNWFPKKPRIPMGSLGPVITIDQEHTEL